MGLVRRVGLVGLGGDVEIISNIPPLTHTPLRQLADFLQKGGDAEVVLLKTFRTDSVWNKV